MNFAEMHDVGAWLGVGPGIPETAQTASATDAAITGITYDRRAASAVNRFQSACAVVQCRGTITSGFTLSGKVQFQDSPNNSDWTNHGDVSATELLLNGAGGAVDDGVVAMKHTVDLANAARYIRYVFTPTLSQTQTSTGLFCGVLIFGGADELPTPNVSPQADATP